MWALQSLPLSRIAIQLGYIARRASRISSTARRVSLHIGDIPFPNPTADTTGHCPRRKATPIHRQLQLLPPSCLLVPDKCRAQLKAVKSSGPIQPPPRKEGQSQKMNLRRRYESQTHCSDEQRRQQLNRIAQRAHRDRKELYIKNLEV